MHLVASVNRYSVIKSSRALVLEETIEIMHRWSTIEESEGRMATTSQLRYFWGGSPESQAIYHWFLQPEKATPGQWVGLAPAKAEQQH